MTTENEETNNKNEIIDLYTHDYINDKTIEIEETSDYIIFKNLTYIYDIENNSIQIIKSII